MEHIIRLTFTGDSFMFALICTVFCTVMLTRFRKIGDIRKAVPVILLKSLGMYAAYFAFSVIGLLVGRLISDHWRAFMQFYLSAFGLALAGGILYHDYKLKTRLIYLSLFVLTWWLLPALSFLFPYEWLIPDIVILGAYIGFSIPRILVMLLLVMILKKMDLDKMYVNSKWDIFLFEAVCLVGVGVHFFSADNFDVETNSYICLVVWLMEIIVYCFYWLFLRESSQKMANEIQMRVAHADLQYLGYLNRNHENLRILKHDLKNQFAYIALLYEQGRDAEAKAFFTELSSGAGKVLNFASSGNRTVDIAVSILADKAEHNGIEVAQSLVVPLDLPFDENDLFSLLINLLDNAFEGAMRSNRPQRKITVQIAPNGAYLMMRIANSVSEDEAEDVLFAMERRSRKGDGHGYGHKIVDRIIQKYNGHVRYAVKDGVFEAIVMLALSREAGGENV